VKRRAWNLIGWRIRVSSCFTDAFIEDSSADGFRELIRSCMHADR
jgi:hypothetical protein